MSRLKMAPKAVLGYWDIRGRAAPIRHLLAYAAIEHEDKRYTVYDDWFQRDKAGLGFDFPNLPYLIDGPIKLTQSLTILRYLATKTGLGGATEAESTVLSLVEQQLVDLHAELAKIAYSPDCEKLKPDYLAKTLPASLSLLSVFLAEKPFAIGSRLTYVDFSLYEYLKKISVLVPEALGPNPKLGDYLARFEALPQMEAYVKGAKPGPINGPMAHWNGII